MPNISEISLHDTIYKIKDDNAVTQEQLDEALGNIDMSELENHVANKDNPHDVTAEQINALPLAGGSVTGRIEFIPEPTYDEDGNLIITTNPYGDATYIDKGELSLGGSKIAGNVTYKAPALGETGHSGITRYLSVGENVYISNIPDPIENDEVANKGYVDNKVNAHIADVENPHNVTAEQIGAATEEYVDTVFASAIQIPVTASSTDGVAYIAAVPYLRAATIDELKGFPIVIIPNKESTSAAGVTLNVNGLGAKAVKRGDNLSSSEWWSFTSASWLKANYPIQVVFNGTYFMVQSMQKPYASDLNGTVSIDKGGTGATTAAAALTALGGVTEARVQEMINAIAIYNGTVS